MAGKIPQNFIDELLARTDIVDLIDGFVPLKKMGKDFKACCPFHDEKTPSFTVSQPKQFYHCFGCGANGSAISFLMEYNHLEFLDAIDELANKAGLSIPQEASQSRPDANLSELYELLELVVRFYSTQLRDHKNALRAVDYLKRRGISGEIAKQFELGYAPAGWDGLILELGKSDAAQERLSKTGMVIKRDNGGYYDRFRDRIMFPIRDPRGRVIGFGGRVIDDEVPKYLNSPETPIYHKGRELYGLYQARHNNKDLQRVYVVEGYMDVIALAQYGVNNAVASLGTAATADHMDRLFRTTAQVVFCFDGDNAGEKAAARAMETVLPLLRDGRQVFYKFLPEGQDPDDYVREFGADKFQSKDDLTTLSDYMVAISKADNDLSTAEGCSLFMSNINPLLELLPEGVFKQLMLQHLEKLTGLPSIKVKVKPTAEPRAAGKRRPLYQSDSGGMTKVSWLISMLLKQPTLAALVDEPESLIKSKTPGIEFFCELLESIKQKPEATTAQTLERWRDSKYSRRLHELSSKQILDDEKVDLELEFLDAIESLLAEISSPFEEARTSSLENASEELKNRLKGLQKSRDSG
jgi:DNA primase